MKGEEVNFMIYTLTFNPSLDYLVKVDDFKLGAVNRTSKEKLNPGGKGINVSIVLSNLGLDTTALGFTAGFTGKEIRRLIAVRGIKDEMIEVDNGISRINVKLSSNEESEINGMGPTISESALDQLFKKFERLKKDDILVLAGSIPATTSDTIYREIMDRVKDKEIKVVVDATKDLLKNVLPLHPFMIKPNNHELGELFNVEIKTREEVIPYAKKLQDMGARNVVVSMAGQGAVMVCENGEVLMSEAPKGTLVNSVGAGDSLVAGFLYGYLTYGNYKEAFKYGISAGSASAFSVELASKEEIEELYKTLQF